MMSPRPNLAIDVHLEDGGASRAAARDVRRGLTGTPKRLPSKYFYDERGSRLFQRITQQPEYYLTRAETRLLERDAKRIAEITEFEDLVELGSGSAEKTRRLIDAGRGSGRMRRYVPFEVSRETAESSARELAGRYPDLEVHAVIGDFERHLEEIPEGGRRLIALLGSTIGNFPDEQSVPFLAEIKRVMRDEDWFLLGIDLVKDKDVLEAAYNDAQGVTAEFNRNILNVINEQVDGDFDVEAFEHVARYNEDRSRIESGLRSKRAQSVRLRRLDLEIEFEPGENLRTEVSCKYTRPSLTRLLARAGLRMHRWFTDESRTFALSLSRTR
jgi:L-histidine N-alpha-methyltransferase